MYNFKHKHVLNISAHCPLFIQATICILLFNLYYVLSSNLKQTVTICSKKSIICVNCNILFINLKRSFIEKYFWDFFWECVEKCLPSSTFFDKLLNNISRNIIERS